MADNNKNNTYDGDIQKKNPRNDQSPLYVGLTRLFSGPLSSFRSQAQIRYKRRDLDRYKFTSASGQSFKKKSYNPFEQTWMSHMFQETIKGNLSSGLLLLTPTEHNRFDHYDGKI